MSTHRLQVHLARRLRALSMLSQASFNAALGSARTARLAAKLSSSAAAMETARARRDVPAYAQLQAGETSKRNYIDAFSLAQRCRHGVIPRSGAELDESAGS